MQTEIDLIRGWRLWSDLHYPPEFECEIIEKAFNSDLENKAVLEVGCGDGRVIRCLAPGCREAIGIDINQQMIGFLQAHLSSENLWFREMSGMKLDFDDHFFDVVIFAWSLHQISDKVQALREARRVLKSNGKAIVFGLAPGGEYEVTVAKLGLDPGPQFDPVEAYEKPLKEVFSSVGRVMTIGRGENDLHFGFQFPSFEEALEAWCWALTNWHGHKPDDKDFEKLVASIRANENGERLFMPIHGRVYIASV